MLIDRKTGEKKKQYKLVYHDDGVVVYDRFNFEKIVADTRGLDWRKLSKHDRVWLRYDLRMYSDNGDSVWKTTHERGNKPGLGM